MWKQRLPALTTGSMPGTAYLDKIGKLKQLDVDDTLPNSKHNQVWVVALKLDRHIVQ